MSGIELVPDDQFIPMLIKHLNGRLRAVFSQEELLKALKGTGLAFDADGALVSCPDDYTGVFDTYIESLLRNKGPLWPALIEGELATLLASRNMASPTVYRKKSKMFTRALDSQVSQVFRLREEIFELQQLMIQARDEQIRDPVSGFYNQVFFEEYLETIGSRNQAEGSFHDAILFIRLDAIQSLNQRYGSEAGDAALRGLGHFLLNHKRENSAFFRMSGPLFSCYLSGYDKETAFTYARQLQQEAADSDDFIQKIQISVAIIDLAEMDSTLLVKNVIFANIMKLAKDRLSILNKIGPGSICQDSTITLRRSSGTVLLIEENDFEADLMRRVLVQNGFETHIVTNGGQAISEADFHRPDVIVSDIYISQMDGFQIRQRLLESQDLRHIPFVLVSRGKDSVTVEKAFSLGIRHFFKKPVMSEELAGTIAALVKDSASERYH